jgi:hypothetical protein
MNLDGFWRNATVINGTYPGPWIQAQVNTHFALLHSSDIIAGAGEMTLK